MRGLIHLSLIVNNVVSESDSNNVVKIIIKADLNKEARNSDSSIAVFCKDTISLKILESLTVSNSDLKKQK